MVFPGEIEGGWEGLVDIAGGAEDRPDDLEVGAMLPFGGLAGGKPVSSFRHDGVANGNALTDAQMEPGEAVCSPQDVGVAMSESHVLFYEGPEVGVVRQGGKEGGDLRESSDMLISDAAFSGVLALRVARKEAAMIFLEVGVAVPSRSQHTGEVFL